MLTRHKFLNCFCLLAILLLVTSANSATYTVTQDGLGVDYSAATFNALTGSKAGNTFTFSGTFTTTITVQINGTSGSPVVLDGYAAGDCDPINAECTSSADLKKGMNIGSAATDPDYVTVQDFRMTRDDGATNPTFRIYSSGGGDLDNLIIQRNYSYMADGQMFYYYRGNNSIVTNNKFFVYGQGGDPSCGVYLVNLNDFIFRGNEVGHDESTYPSGCTSAEMIELHGCTDILMEYNDIYGAAQQSGIRPKEDYGGYQNNIIIRFNKVHDNNGANGKGIYPLTKVNQQINNVYVYGNFIYNNYIAGVMGGDGVNGYYVWSNVIHSNTSNGVSIYQKDGSTIQNVYIYNNTISRNATKADAANSESGIQISAGTNVNIKNNILWNNRTAGYGSKYYQIYALTTLASLEHDTYYHESSDPTVYYSGAARTLDTMQSTYEFENDVIAGEIADPGFLNPDGVDETYGTDDDDYRLDGTNINDGYDISQNFSVTVQGTVYWMNYDLGLSPAIDWTVNASGLETEFTDHPLLDRDTVGWTRGAYVFGGDVSGTLEAGLAGGNVSEAQIVAGLDGSGDPITIIVTMTGTTWDATLGADNAVSTAFIQGFDSAQSEAGGWNATIRDVLTYAAITRDSDTQATLTIPATAGYAITANETITVTIPASATAAGQVIVAGETMTISNIDPPQPAGSGTSMYYNSTGRSVNYSSTGKNIIIGQ